jgi:hypothetical protein
MLNLEFASSLVGPAEVKCEPFQEPVHGCGAGNRMAAKGRIKLQRDLFAVALSVAANASFVSRDA